MSRAGEDTDTADASPLPVTATQPPVLELSGASKRFGAVTALDGVDLSVAQREVLALLGDNGAGKSTLIKCISGVHRLDEGTMQIDGVEVRCGSPSEARELGIETVTRISRCSTISALRRTSSPVERWLGRAGCLVGCGFFPNAR